MLKILLAVFLLFITCNLQAQSWEIGGTVGGAGYMGDLNQNNPVKISGGAFGALVKYNFNGYLSAKLNYLHGTIAGADSTSHNQQSINRNLSFSTPLNELSGIVEFNFMKYIPSVSDNIYTPFIYLGVGVVGYRPTATYNGQTYDLRSFETEGQSKPYPNKAISIPYGAGIKYNFAGAWNLIADIGYRNPNTDYLDDVSGKYPAGLSNPTSVALSDRSGEKNGKYIGMPGTQRGDMRNRDTYLFIGFTISYTFITPKCYY
ncbi:MAG TPA: DUF6089 family protein [Mucilaginibacter sp.]